MDFSERGLAIKPESSITSDNQDYGYKAYLTNLPYKNFGYLTLTDHFYNEIAPSKERDDFIKKFPQLRENIFKTYHGKLGMTDIPIFTEKDMRRALAYYCIKFLREANFAELNKFIYHDSTLADIDKFFNIIFSPEYHIPRIFSTTDFKLHKLQDPKSEEIYSIALFHKHPDIIRLFCLSKYSTNQELLNITDIAATSAISKSADVFSECIEYAIDDTNAEILAFCIPWYEAIKVANRQTSQFEINEIESYKLYLSILQNDIQQVSYHMQKRQPTDCELNKLCEVLEKSQKDHSVAMSLLLDYSTTEIDEMRGNCKMATLLKLFVLSNQVDSIPELLINNTHSGYIMELCFMYGIDKLECERFHLNYARLLEKSLLIKKTGVIETALDLYH